MTSHIDTIIKEKVQEFRDTHTIEWPLGDGKFELLWDGGYPKPEEILDALHSIAQAAVEEIRIGNLRQWLNEERITDSKKMVTDREIRVMLGIDSLSQEEQSDKEGGEWIQSVLVSQEKTHDKARKLIKKLFPLEEDKES